MSRIQALTSNYTRGKDLNQNKKQTLQIPSTCKNTTTFGKVLTNSEAAALDKALTKNYLGGFKGTFLNMLSDKVGEIQNIIFIGIGTAFVAPIFIAYNPLAKQDEKTKKYSALRQPISAVIATATGLGINYPIGNLFNKYAAQGKIKAFDMSAKPPSDFLKKRYTRIMKNYPNLKGLDKEYFDYVNKDGKIKSKEDFKEKFKTFKEFESEVHNATTLKYAQKLLNPENKKGLKNTSFRDWLIQEHGFEIDPIDSDMLNPDVTKNKFKDITAINFLRAVGFDEKMIKEDTIRTFVNKEFYKKAFQIATDKNKPSAEKIVKAFINIAKQENINLNEDDKDFLFKKLTEEGFDDNERKTITRISESFIKEKSKNEEKITMKTLFKVMEKYNNFSKNKELLKKPVETVFVEIAETLMNSGINIDGLSHLKEELKTTSEEIKKAKIAEKLAKNIAKNISKQGENKFKAYNKLQGIILSLIILPFSCGILNWSYPRIMEKCFPKLAASKAQEKGGK